MDGVDEPCSPTPPTGHQHQSGHLMCYEGRTSSRALDSRYPNRLTGEMRTSVFNRSYHEEVYHVAAYTLYRIKLLLGNAKIDARYSKLRWHIMMAVKYYVCGGSIPNPSSPKIKRACNEIERFMSGNDDSTVKEIKELCSSIVDVNDVTRDKLKGISLVPEVKSQALRARAS